MQKREKFLDKLHRCKKIALIPVLYYRAFTKTRLDSNNAGAVL